MSQESERDHVDPRGGHKGGACTSLPAGLGLLVLEGRDRAPLLMKITTANFLFGPEGRELGAIVHAEHPGRADRRPRGCRSCRIVRACPSRSPSSYGAARGGEGLGRLDAGEVVVAAKDALEAHWACTPSVTRILRMTEFVRKAPPRLLDDRAARPQQAHVGAPVGAVDEHGKQLRNVRRARESKGRAA